METDDGAFPQRTALSLSIAFGIAIQQNPRRFQFIQIQVVGNLEAVIDEVIVDRVLVFVDLDLP